jgi:uncharacterized protein
MSEMDSTQAEQEALVAEWLRATPGFFERHAELLNDIRLKHPHEDRAISLQERQMSILSPNEAYAPWVAKPLCGPLAELP